MNALQNVKNSNMPEKVTARSKKRVVNKTLNRQKLIQATLDTIVEVGIENTSVSQILAKAQLSRGMINLHFSNKENLLLEALKSHSQSYYESWFENLDKVKAASPAVRLQVIIESDLDACILNKDYIVIWYEFRGKARTNSSYQKYTDTRDKLYRDVYYKICAELVKNESLKRSVSRNVAHGVLAMLEGMWIDFYLHSDSFNRTSAKKTLFIFLASVFPNQFTYKGANG